jgi:hypothetical protein
MLGYNTSTNSFKGQPNLTLTFLKKNLYGKMSTLLLVKENYH